MEKFGYFNLNFKDKTNPQMIIMAGVVADCMDAHEGYKDGVPKEVPDSQRFRSTGSQLTEGVKAAQNGDRHWIAVRDAIRAELEAMLRMLAHWAEIKSYAAKDPSLLLNLGLEPKKKTVKTINHDDVAAPKYLKADQGKLSGTAKLSSNRVPGAASYQAMMCIGDPTVEGNWKLVEQFARSSNILITNLVAGTVYHFRIRALGKNGHGPWSPVATIMVI